MTRLTVAPDAERAAEVVAALAAGAVSEARTARGTAHLALAGGETPRRAYELLATRLADWEGVELWFGDERAVPPEHPQSNFRMVAETLLAGAGIPPERVHRLRGELEPQAAARSYAAELRERVPRDSCGVPVLDLALLGLGEDGHTASLFPGDPALEARGELCVVVHAPKPPSVRITLTLEVLRAARRTALLATGPAKAAAVAAVLAGPSLEAPASLLGGAATELIVDAEAAPREAA